MGKNLINETGHIYGKLLVTHSIKSLEMKKTMWYCECECGKSIICSGSDLRTGRRTSCGKHCNSQKDETGNIYGFLEVLKKDSTLAKDFPDKSIHWICKCNLCGSIKSVSGRNLRNGNTRSCGCLKSTGEQFISKFLNKLEIKYQREYTFSDLIGKDKPLRFDFAIFDKNNNILGLIEFQGRQHFVEVDYFKEDLQTRQDYDNKKLLYCKERNIPILYIIPSNLERPEKNNYENIFLIITNFLKEIEKGEKENVKIFNKYI